MRGLRLLLLLAFLLTLPIRAGAEVLNVVVTLPWLALLTSFIGGPNVAVAPLLEWNPKRVLRLISI